MSIGKESLVASGLSAKEIAWAVETMTSAYGAVSEEDVLALIRWAKL
jgi:hypothetical protein